MDRSCMPCVACNRWKQTDNSRCWDNRPAYKNWKRMAEKQGLWEAPGWILLAMAAWQHMWVSYVHVGRKAKCISFFFWKSWILKHLLQYWSICFCFSFTMSTYMFAVSFTVSCMCHLIYECLVYQQVITKGKLATVRRFECWRFETSAL